MAGEKIKARFDWIPDWKNETHYPKHQSELTAEEWIWAFLRRNPEYLADVEFFRSLPDFHPGGGKTGKFSGRALYDFDLAVVRFCDPPALPDETVLDYEMRTGTSAGESIEEYLMKKWGVWHLAHPSEDEPILEVLPDDREPFKVERDIYTPNDVVDHVLRCAYETPGRILISINPSMPIKTTLEEIKEIIMYEREKAGVQNTRETGPRDRNLPKMLRSLDAHMQGATYRQIAKVIFPEKSSELSSDSGPKAAEYHVKQAMKIMERPYQALAPLLRE